MSTAADANKHAQQILGALELANGKGAFGLEEATAAFVAYLNLVKILNEWKPVAPSAPRSLESVPEVVEDSKEE